MIGRTVSHYKIEAQLGQGGMGVVYKARDVKLDRTVAIKFLPAHLTSNEGAKQRFVREAQAASALDHANVLTIHEIDETPEGELFIVMAYYEGRTVRDLLAEGPLDVDEARQIVLKVTAGLSAAHKKGILHRDIKPENVVLTDDGEVKILDFGLAKLTDHTRVTQEGITVGTLAYMSPEQITGAKLDERSDLFSVAVMFYELLTGVAPFKGEHDAALLYSITHTETEPVTKHRADVPPEIDRALSKALEKNPAARYASVSDFARDLGGAAGAQTSTTRAAGGIESNRWWRPVVYVAIVLVLVVVVVVVSRMRGDGESTRDSAKRPAHAERRITLRQVTFAEGVEEYPAFAADGERIAYVAEVDGYRQIFVKSLTSIDERQITDAAADNIQPAWSPDGSTMLFTRSNLESGKLQPGDIFGTHNGGDVWAYDVASKQETRIVENAFNPSFSPDGQQIAFDASWSGARRIWVADRLGRNALQVSFDESEVVDHIVPRWSPDGSKIVFQHVSRTNFDVWIVAVESRKMVAVTRDVIMDLNPVWSAAGNEIFFSSARSGGMNVWSVPVGADGTPTGPPRQVTTGAGQDVHLAAAADGSRMAMSVLRLNADLWRLPLSRDFAAAGVPEPVVSTTREDSRGRWSPDGTEIAFNSDREGNMNIWVRSLADGVDRRITKGPGGDYQPTWSPDGKRLVFFSSREGSPDIWMSDLHSGETVQLTRSPSIEINPFYSPDGRQIVYQSDQGGHNEVWVMDADGGNPRALTQIGATGHFMLWSADGESLIFKSAGAGISTVGLDGGEPGSFADVPGGYHMSFSPDGDYVLDVAGHRIVWITPLPSGDARKIFEFDDPGVRIDYPVLSPDGRSMLFDRVLPEGGDIWLLEFTKAEE